MNEIHDKVHDKVHDTSVHDIEWKWRRARVFHACTICGGTIPPGARYCRVVYRDLEALDPRKLRTVKYHLICDEIREHEIREPIR